MRLEKSMQLKNVKLIRVDSSKEGPINDPAGANNAIKK